MKDNIALLYFFLGVCGGTLFVYGISHGVVDYSDGDPILSSVFGKKTFNGGSATKRHKKHRRKSHKKR